MERILKSPKFDDDVCPLCQTNNFKPVVLVPIDGTRDGQNYKAIQVHLDCILDRSVYISAYNVILIS